MAKAGRVPGIRPKQSLHDNAQKVVEKRLDELLSWRHALTEPEERAALHNMRIAAKRLRYALEIFEVCFPEARPLVKELAGIQEDLGEIHDLDVLVQIMQERLQSFSAPITQQAVEISEAAANRSEQVNRLRAALYAQARDRRRLGLLALIGDDVVDRRKRYEAFVERWSGDRLDAFADAVLVATGLREPEMDDAPQDEGAQGETVQLEVAQLLEGKGR